MARAGASRRALMDQAFARALLADGRLDREIERRRRLRELEEERQWIAVDDGGLSLLVGLLGRLQAELERSVAPGQKCDEEAIQALESMHAECLELLEKLEVLAARDEDEAAGIERRCVVHSAVRPQLKLERPPASPKPSSDSSRVQRVAVSEKVVVSEGAAGLDGWKCGKVRYFDQSKGYGVISLVGSGGEVLVRMTAVKKAGLTNIFGGQRVEFQIVSGPLGKKEADKLKLV
jgi:CspA family cold shock protein